MDCWNSNDFEPSLPSLSEASLDPSLLSSLIPSHFLPFLPVSSLFSPFPLSLLCPPVFSAFSSPFVSLSPSFFLAFPFLPFFLWFVVVGCWLLVVCCLAVCLLSFWCIVCRRWRASIKIASRRESALAYDHVLLLLLLFQNAVLRMG